MSCHNKKIHGFLLVAQHTYLGLFEGPANKVFAQVERLVRRPNIFNITVLHEIDLEMPEWDQWFDAGYDLADLPTDLIAQTEGLAQIVAGKLNADQD